MVYYNSFKYEGSDKSEYESEDESFGAAIRANHPIPSQCRLFYFEVDIIDKGNNGYARLLLFFFVLKFTNISLILSFQKRNWNWILHKGS